MDSSAGRRCREAPWNRFLLALIGAAAVRAPACRRLAAYAAAEKPRLQQVGQTISFYAAGGHTAGGRAARLAGTLRAARQPGSAMARDCSRSIRLHARQIRDLTLFGFGLSMKSGPDPVLGPSATRQRAGKVAWPCRKTL